MRRVPHVAVLIETSRAYGRGLLEGVAQYNRQFGFWSTYFEPHGLNDAPPKWLSSWKGDGILVRINDRRMARAILATGLPAVDLRGRVPRLGLPFIGVDNFQVARLAFEHLWDRGFRHFGFCGLARGEYFPMDRRREFFQQRAERADCPCLTFEARDGRRRTAIWEEEQDQIAAWIVKLPRPLGVMACNDDRGHQVLDACRRAGVLVPDEVAVVSVDNDAILCNMAEPPLTSIDVNAEQIGYEAAALLDRLMRRGARAQTPSVEIHPRGVVARQSSDVLAVTDREVAAAVRYIRENACAGLSVEGVLRQVGLSRSVLDLRFKTALGRTPKAEILRVQLERARQLLSESRLPLDDVAARCGFSSAKYLGDVFFRELGVRPGTYRQRFQRPG
jgi:LacI family transcriptional regulator